MKNRWFWLKQADDFTTTLLDCKIVYNCDRSGQSSKCDDDPYANSTIYKMHLQFKADMQTDWEKKKFWSEISKYCTKSKMAMAQKVWT
jgi:hypothetical protein